MKTPKELVQLMTLEEKCSLLSGLDFWHTKPVERLGIPSVMVSDGPHGLRKQNEEADHLGHNESIKAVCFPPACASAASFDRDMLRRIGEAIGDQCQHERVAVNLGPAINIKRSPLCGRNFEYISEDPFLAAELAVSIVQGIQSRNVGVSVKHFAANSQEHRRMSSDSVIDQRTLREIYLPAFEAACKRGKAWTFMCSYNKLNGELASQHKWLLTDLLRGEWGFDGCVMSDWGAVSDRVKGVAAGLDLEMPASHGERDRQVLKAVQEGRLEEKYVDICVERVLDVAQRYLKHAKPDTPWDMEADHRLAGEMAADCMVLLKNQDAVLPLGEGEQVAVIGEFAKKPRFQGGGSSHINSFRVTSLMDALADKPNVTYAQGYHLSGREDAALVAQAVEAARRADKAVIVAGLPDSFESEGYDREHMQMPGDQVALIEAVAAVNPNTVVLLYNGSPVEMPWIGCVKGVVEGYLGGQNLGWANRAVLWGEVNPSGRLPESFPKRLEDTPCYLTYGGEGNTAVYSEGVFVGYRYYTARKMEVLFPFGYGLSYTKFDYSNLRLSADSITDADVLTAYVDVTNAGAVAGKEVVQVYVSSPKCAVFRPVRELKGFEKIFLQPGETKTVAIQLDKRAFAYWCEEVHDWYAPAGEYQIQVCRHADEVVLSAPVQMVSPALPHADYDLDTIQMDLSPKAYALLKATTRRVMGSAEPEERSETAREAITDEMNDAMERYSPLRAALSFSDVTNEQLAALVKALNEAERG